MRILSVVVGTLNDSAASIRIWSLANILHLAGHEIHLVRFMRKANLKTLNNIFDLNNIPNSIVLVSIPTVHFRILREIVKGDYDLVYANTHISTFCSILCRLKGVPLIFDMHGGLVEEQLFSMKSKSGFEYILSLCQIPLNKFIDFINLRLSNMIICVSKKMIEYLHRKKRVPLKKMACVTNGVDLKLFKQQVSNDSDQLRKYLGLNNMKVFGYVGGLSRYQGVEDFIEAARNISDPTLAFVIIGAREKGMERNILFLPRMPREKLPGYYSICDVLVLPRPDHPATEMAAPTKFAEYTAMGKPILTTDVGDAAEFVRKYKCGIVIPSNKRSELINGILQFRDLSASELKMMGNNSRKLAESEFDWNKVAIRLLDVIEHLDLP